MLEVLPLSQADRLPKATGLAPVDPDTTLADQMMAAARSAGSEQPEPIADFAIDALDAEALLDRVPRPMSRGERQVSAVLITLAVPFDTLSIVDPTAGLDARRKRAVVDLLVDLSADRPIAVASDDLGLAVHRPWTPLPVPEVVELFDRAPFRWWIAGGHALELHLGRRWRSHSDTDVGIARDDAPLLRHLLRDWQILIAAAGTLSPWDGTPLDAERAQNNLWCRRSSDSPFALDILIGAGDGTDWVYRRNAVIRRPWNEAVLGDSNGVPYLAPELQLLFKSKGLRDKDTADARTVIPRLEPDRRTWLAQCLPPDHPWQTMLT